VVTVPGRGYRLIGVQPSRARPIGATLALPDKPSIAVLPFQSFSPDPEQEYFADGIVEEIITALSRFSGLFVIARNSTFTYKGRAVDVKQVGCELGVRYVLEGAYGNRGHYDKRTAQRRAVQGCRESTLRRWGRRDVTCGVVTTVVDDCTAVARDRCYSWSPTAWGQDYDWSPRVAADRARWNCWWYGGHECKARYVCPYYYTSSGQYGFTGWPTQSDPDPAGM
jgi:hypothetical protein